MRIAITGASGFLGRYVVQRLVASGHSLRCWYRPASNRGEMDFDERQVQWLPGELTDPSSNAPLLRGCDAVVHAALYRPGTGFIGNEGDLLKFLDRNVLGTMRLIEAAMREGVPRFVFVSTCAVHDVILDDRPLDEAHPLWPTSHYGAHKAAIEAFVSSFGRGQGYPICAVRPTGIYGLAHPPRQSKWFDLVREIAEGRPVACVGGGKEVHAADVARAIEILLDAPEADVRGRAFNCCDQYIARHHVATLARQFSGSDSPIEGEPAQPRHQIDTAAIRALGMQFGGDALLERTVRQLVECARV